MDRIRSIRDGHRDRGQVALEYIGFLPFLLLVGLGGIQLGWTAYVTQQAETAARTAARVEARYPGEGEAAGRASIRPSLGTAASTVVHVAPLPDTVTATVTITINSVVPGIASRPVTRIVVMPNEDPR
ncbi:TadE/TadG family type IV pilus assembly protein [Streptomyces sp. AP-93]|uniref:TadE/TadG family type IV pilus assembly protein n=1 Tax=Streptomyces sp. AP-93 TaxID=2929048 RepID=UPI001FAF49A0|nr:TadE/TadG family type IV pilus assembly protein [Streptomyces sp. AP-93]MCJ0874730.1 pilus assembly protein [Streptomyces sp. AP-93]